MGYVIGAVLMVLAWVLAFTLRAWWAYALVATTMLVFVGLVVRGLRVAATGGHRSEEGRQRPSALH